MVPSLPATAAMQHKLAQPKLAAHNQTPMCVNATVLLASPPSRFNLPQLPITTVQKHASQHSLGQIMQHTHACQPPT
jgi:hypothetical protein